MEEDLKSKTGKWRGGVYGVLASLLFYPAVSFSVYYQFNETLESMSPKLRADKAQEYVESWGKIPWIIKYSPWEVGGYFSAKKYAQENPLKKKKGIQI